jgi:disulfide oxidoreductase YuzD
MSPAKQLKPKFKRPSKLKARKHLHMDAMLAATYQGFSALPDHRRGKVEIPLPDALMAGFAMFSLKDPSLLAFDERRRNDDNLARIFGIGKVPSDTQLREILDLIDPQRLRPSFRDIFRQLQRGKALEPMVYFEGCYLLSLDGTGSFSSETLSSASCMVKKSRSGKETYYQQVLGAAIVHPDFKEVIPLAPEMIIRQDGSKKNDCERNAAKRFLQKLRQDHPHLPLIVVEDGLSSNGPHIRDLQQHGMRYILGAKPGDHPLLFHHLEQATAAGQITEHRVIDPDNPKITHQFRFLNGVPLNQANLDLHVNVIDYWQHSEGKKSLHFIWVTDFMVTRENVYTLMRGGRARWKIENETFNTLKNQGYHFEHNFGLGKKHLSEVFVMLMMLAFLVDQTQQLTSALFRSVWQKFGTKRSLWENVRTLFEAFELESMEMLYTALLNGYRRPKPEILYDDP